MKHFTSKTQKIGEIGENEACMFLVKQGFSVVERNSSNKFGEIDIVAKKKGKYYFFEVKTAKQGGWLNPAENLTKEKLRKFLISAEYYALTHKVDHYSVQGILVLLGVESRIEIIDIT